MDNGEIFLTDSEVKPKIKITRHPENDGYPAWSSDGKKSHLEVVSKELTEIGMKRYGL